MYVVSKNGLRLRSNYTDDSDVITVMKYGDKIEIMQKIIKDFELWIRGNYNGVEGYASGKYLDDDPPGYEEGMEYWEHLGQFDVTAYTWTGNACANGNFPMAEYTVACNSLPFGTEIYIEGLGHRFVEDRGPDYLGSNWLDVYMDTYDECVNWGIQTRDVYLVK